MELANIILHPTLTLILNAKTKRSASIFYNTFKYAHIIRHLNFKLFLVHLQPWFSQDRKNKPFRDSSQFRWNKIASGNELIKNIFWAKGIFFVNQPCYALEACWQVQPLRNKHVHRSKVCKNRHAVTSDRLTNCLKGMVCAGQVSVTLCLLKSRNNIRSRVYFNRMCQTSLL